MTEKKIGINRDVIFQKNDRVHHFWQQKEWRTFIAHVNIAQILLWLFYILKYF